MKMMAVHIKRPPNRGRERTVLNKANLSELLHDKKTPRQV